MARHRWPANALAIFFLVAGIALCHSATPQKPVMNQCNQPYPMVDPDTPATIGACVKTVCTDDYMTCEVVNGTATGPLHDLELVWSDEFEVDGRRFDVKDKDPYWTAVDIYYAATGDEEVYKPDTVVTANGSMVITVSEVPDGATSLTPNEFGFSYNVTKTKKSGMVQSWNKFCYTGGYLEARIKLPGDGKTPGFWPAFWLMGNLGRPGYTASNTGVWQYSINNCTGSGPTGWDKLPGQLINACRDTDSLFNSSWLHQLGLNPKQGRGAPEIDVFEITLGYTDVGVDGKPETSQTLQMAPIAPRGTHWLRNYTLPGDKLWENPFYQDNPEIPDGTYYPGNDTTYRTGHNEGWVGDMSEDFKGDGSAVRTAPSRPGSLIQDSFSAITHLQLTHFLHFHKWGVHWEPGEFIRWYIDDVMLYEVNKNALLARSNETGAHIIERMIPKEPMEIILNVALSEQFSSVSPLLKFPDSMLVDYVRLYQDPKKVKLDCDPPDYPTAKYIEANREWYMQYDFEEPLVPGGNNAAAILQSYGVMLAAALGAWAVLESMR